MTRPPFIDDLASEVEGLLESSARLLVGITGPPGAGKTTVAAHLTARARERLGFPSVGTVPMDGFHLSDAALDRLDRRERKGAPDTFDVGGFVATLRRIVEATEDVYVPGFDHGVGEPIAASDRIPATARLVVVEGNYLALDDDGWREVAPLLDRLYYVDADPDVRRERLVRRHREAGLSEEDARAWVETVDEPNARLIATTRHRAHAVLDADR